MVEWPYGRMADLENGCMIEWLYGRMADLENGCMVELQNEIMK